MRTLLGMAILGFLVAGTIGAMLFLVDLARTHDKRDVRPFTPTAPVSREAWPARLDKVDVLFFYRAPHERFAYVTAGPVELTGGLDVPALMFQRQGPDGLWYTIEAYPVGFDAWDKARAYDTDPINGRPLNKEEDK